ncbi:pyrroloquinoline quinone biosynthesis protein PqqB [Solimonas flava]|uniref:pyrroloquinoline quinone biosynthesis protein PqqB n=1 Tax=Solimonas flava TaxID=415849 RepID=UPI00048A081D|nr:pyrroloquinoline quinone biosynthesis protein PqqB [Solimonas flava]
MSGETLTVRVLGSAAGGGFPQWNCNCAMCDGLRRGRVRAKPRTQSSIAVSADRTHWLLINASPDLRAQILATPDLQPARTRRDSGIAAVLLTDAQIDHVAGLAMLREATQPLPVYCTNRVRDDLRSGLPMLPLLEPYCGSRWHEIRPDGEAFAVDGVPGIRLRALPLHSKPPPYSPHRARPAPGDNLGLLIENPASGQRLFYAPGLGVFDEDIDAAMRAADLMLVDGTCWTDDEMSRRGVGHKRATEMGHLPQSGAGGMLEWLQRHPDKRRVLIHINNTNPILDEDSAERAQLRLLGIEVAEDGMELSF